MEKVEYTSLHSETAADLILYYYYLLSYHRCPVDYFIMKYTYFIRCVIFLFLTFRILRDASFTGSEFVKCSNKLFMHLDIIKSITFSSSTLSTLMVFTVSG